MGGAFDPVHEGHLSIAREARRALNLRRVFFIPNRSSPIASKMLHASASDRYAMLRKALRGAPFFSVSRSELSRRGPSYTIDTVRRFRRQFGSARLYFILGLDSFLTIEGWRESDRLLQELNWIVIERKQIGVSTRKLRPLFARLSALKRSARTYQIESSPNGEIRLFRPRYYFPHSSTEIRARRKEGRSVTGLVPKAVQEYMEAHGLYQKEIQ